MSKGEFVINQRIIKADLGRVLRGAGEMNARKTCPINRAEAHRTRFAGRIQLAIFEFKCAKLRTCLPDRQDFGMCRRVVARGYAIFPFGDDDTIFNDHRAKRSAAPASDTIHRQPNRSFHELIFHECFFCPTPVRK